MRATVFRFVTVYLTGSGLELGVPIMLSSISMLRESDSLSMPTVEARSLPEHWPTLPNSAITRPEQTLSASNRANVGETAERTLASALLTVAVDRVLRTVRTDC